MLKFSSFLIIIVFFSCVNSKNETNVLVFEPHIKEYMDAYIDDNESLNAAKHVIIIQCVSFKENEFTINIICEMPENIAYAFTDTNDSIYYGYYKEFKVFLVDNNQKILRSGYNNISSLKDLYSGEIIPIMYDGMFWSIKIKDRKIIDFSYQYCRPDVEVVERLKSISIPSGWSKNKGSV